MTATAPIPQLGEANRTCASCVYWQGRAGDTEAECRATTPKPLLRPDGTDATVWPKPGPAAWCGEWSPPRTQMQSAEEQRVRDALVVRDLLGGMKQDADTARLAGVRR